MSDVVHNTYLRSLIAPVILFTALLISGCATPMALPLHKHESHYIPSGDEGKALIYVYWEFGYIGGARGIYVCINGERVGGLNRGTYFVYEADPGEIVISAENWLGEDSTNLITVEAGEVHYIRGRLVIWGDVDAIPKIEVVNNDEGEAAVLKLKYETLD